MRILHEKFIPEVDVILYNSHKVCSHLGAYMLQKLKPEAAVLSCDYSLISKYIDMCSSGPKHNLFILGFNLSGYEEARLNTCSDTYINYSGIKLSALWYMCFRSPPPDLLEHIDNFNLLRGKCTSIDEFTYYGMLGETMTRIDSQVEEYGKVLFSSALVPELATRGNFIRSFLSTLAQNYYNRAYKSNILNEYQISVYVINCNKFLTRFLSSIVGDNNMLVVYEDVIINDVEQRSWTVICKSFIDVKGSVAPKYDCIGNSDMCGMLTNNISPLDFLASVEWLKEIR